MIPLSRNRGGGGPLRMKDMKKFSITLTVLMFIAAGGLIAADKLTRIGEGISVVQSGSTTKNGKSLVESSSSTNIFQIQIVTATASGAETASTNTFGTAFIATPSVFKGMVSGANGTQNTNANLARVTVTTSGLIVTGLSTNGDTGANSIPFIVYGYTRTGTFQ